MTKDFKLASAIDNREMIVKHKTSELTYRGSCISLCEFFVLGISLYFLNTYRGGGGFHPIPGINKKSVIWQIIGKNKTDRKGFRSFPYKFGES